MVISNSKLYSAKKTAHLLKIVKIVGRPKRPPPLGIDVSILDVGNARVNTIVKKTFRTKHDIIVQN